MIYTQLSNTYKYDVLATAIYGREVEYFHYDFDRLNFEFMLNVLSENSYRADIEKRHAETLVQMGNVTAMISALQLQIDDTTMYEQAVQRAIEKRLKNEDKK